MTSDRSAGPIEVPAEAIDSTGIYGTKTVLLEKLPAGTSKEFTIDITGSSYLEMEARRGEMEITDILVY